MTNTAQKAAFGFNMQGRATNEEKMDMAFAAYQALSQAAKDMQLMNADNDFDAEMDMMAQAMQAMKAKATSFMK